MSISGRVWKNAMKCCKWRAMKMLKIKDNQKRWELKGQEKGFRISLSKEFWINNSAINFIKCLQTHNHGFLKFVTSDYNLKILYENQVILTFKVIDSYYNPCMTETTRAFPFLVGKPNDSLTLNESRPGQTKRWTISS